MKIPFVDLKRNYNSIKDEIDAAIKDVIDNTAFVLGKNVEDFEKNFADFNNSRFCVGVNSGTASLHLALLSLGIGKGDEVITVPNTFFATAEAISLTGATPVFVEVEKKGYLINPENIKKAITEKTKAILPVHLFGQCAEMDPIMEIAEENSLNVIEDACQAHGAEYNNKKAGSMGKIGCFSFYPGKNLGSFGEAGAIITNDEEIAEKIRLLRAHGEKPKYYHHIVGLNYRMSGIQGAVLKTKLKHIEDWNEKRRKNAKLYNEALNGLVETPAELEGRKHIYHIYLVKTLDEKRDAMMKFLNDNGIATGLHYPVPLHLQEVYKELGYKIGDFPVTEDYVKKMISLPMFPELKEEEIGFVGEKIKEFLK